MTLVTLIESVSIERRNKIRDEKGIEDEGPGWLSIGKLRSFVVKRDREMGQQLEEDVWTKVGFLVMNDPMTCL